MAITVKEKEYSRDRISRKIDHAIESLQAAEDPSFMDRLGRQAKQKALKSLRIGAMTTEVEEIEEEKDHLANRDRLGKSVR